MTEKKELFEVVADYAGKDGDPQFLPVSKGDIVRVIKKESGYFTVEKKVNGKVPQVNLRPYSPPPWTQIQNAPSLSMFRGRRNRFRPRQELQNSSSI